MKPEHMLLLFFFAFSLASNSSATTIDIYPLDTTSYACELCYHNSTCTYYDECQNMTLDATDDYVIQVVFPRVDFNDGKMLYDFTYSRVLSVVAIVCLVAFIYLLARLWL